MMIENVDLDKNGKVWDEYEKKSIFVDHVYHSCLYGDTWRV